MEPSRPIAGAEAERPSVLATLFGVAAVWAVVSSGSLADEISDLPQRRPQSAQQPLPPVDANPPATRYPPPSPPDYRTALLALETLAQQQGAAADRLIAFKTKPLFASPRPAEPTEAGRLFPGSVVSVQQRSGDWLEVRIEGWQQEGAAAHVYALAGRRILTAVLEPLTQSRVTVHRRVVDPDTEQTWHQVSLTGWVERRDLVSEGAGFWSYAAELHAATCSVCHPLPAPSRFPANNWMAYLKAMRRNIGLSEDEYRVLLRFLQLNASDTRLIAQPGRVTTTSRGERIP